MRIKKWLGMASNASPYAISGGVNQEQINLQNIVPGQLTPRKGMEALATGLISNNASGESGAILSLYRQARGGGVNDGVIALVAGTSNNLVRDLSTGTTLLTGEFSQLRPLSCCEDRHGNLYVFQGSGVAPKRWGGTGTTMVDIGIPAPISAPLISRLNEEGGFYVERVDVTDGGSAYWAPPAITVTGTLGTGGVAASLRAIVEAGTITAVEVINPGHNYTGPVTLSFATNTSATNNFSATAQLASTTSSGIANSSPVSTTGTLTNNHTVAPSQSNSLVRYSTGNVTTSDQTAAATFTSGSWYATVPLYRTTNNADSGAKVTLQFNNAVYSETVTSSWGLNAFTTRSGPLTGYGAGANWFAKAALFSFLYPQVVRSDGPTYDLLWEASSSLFYADVAIPGGTGGVARIRFGTTGAAFSNVNHPQRSGSYQGPNSISSVVVQNQGSGYPSGGTSVTINFYTANTSTIVGTAVLSFSTVAVSFTTTSVDLPTTYNGFTVVDPGTGWAVSDTAYVQLRSRLQALNTTPQTTYANAQKVSFIVASSTSNGNSIANNIKVNSGGSGFVLTPEILYSGGGGYGLELQASVAAGVITAVTVLDGGANFTSVPSLSVSVGAATAAAVMRPTMVGDYDCAARWVDDSVPEDKGGPIYSSFSPITSFNAGPNVTFRSTNELTWSIPFFTAKPARASKVELWRTSADQSLVFYKLATFTPSSLSVAAGTDRFSDEQLFDPDRTDYAAIPVVLPNGALNAYRFGQPRTDMAVCVSFQDRLWYGVSTSGQKINSLFFSEYDEFESCPDTNEIAIQQNIKDADYLTALIPFGGSLLAMQTAHCYSMAYASDPTLDATVQLVGFRGCFNQNTWDIFEGTLYVMDERGIYAMQASGGIESISEPIADIFRSKLLRKNGTSDSWFHLKIDPYTKILRLFCSFIGDGNPTFPSRALCYHIESKTWWIERWPSLISASTTVKSATDIALAAYASSNRKLYRLDQGFHDVSVDSIKSVTITDGGSGYASPPAVTAAGFGAELDAVIDGTGRVVAVIVKNGGTGYTSGGAVTFTGGGGSGATGTVVLSTGELQTIPWSFHTGNMEFPTDRESPKGGGFESRSVALTYKPTLATRPVALRLFYNNSPAPRNNVVVRDRGTGFVQEPDSPNTTLDMSADRSALDTATGVSKALFSGRAFDDMGGTDRHVSAELLCQAGTLVAAESEANAPIIYELDVQGVGE